MPLLGPNDLKNVILPPLWDSAEMQRLSLRDGTTYLQMANDINDSLQLVNDALQSGWLANLFSLTDEVAVEYGVGSSNGYEDMTEYGTGDAQRATTTGHMLPIKNKDRKMGWTRLFLEEARRSQLDEDIVSVVQDTVDVWEKTLLTRLFKATADTGAANGLGAGGKSVPFADGGTADANYIPRQMPARGGAFTSSHTHYLRLGGKTQANIETVANHLWEHGHDAPYDMLVSNTDIGSWSDVATVTGFVPRNMGLIQYGNQVSIADVGDNYQGVIQTKRGPVRLTAHGRIPTGYWAMLKTYGQLDQRNPLRVRYDPMFGNGAKLYVEQPGLSPLANAISRVKFGVGVGKDRTNAVLVLDGGSGSYTSPTIS